MTIDNKRELLITRICGVLTLVCVIGLFHYLFGQARLAYRTGDAHALIETIVYSVIMAIMMYSTSIYVICLLGYYKRRAAHRPASEETLEAFFVGKAPTLSIVIPSYKEEHSVIWQTMLSAALAEYPQKNVTLLIDDPYRPRALEDMVKLEDTRRIPTALQAMFDERCARYRAEADAFRARLAQAPLQHAEELDRLVTLYREVAAWYADRAADVSAGRDLQDLPHSDRFFINNILLAPARRFRVRAQDLRRKLVLGIVPEEEYLRRQYGRLEGLFNVRFASFERKKYANLSHESNKAMNLNSYLGLMGKSWKEIDVKGESQLRVCAAERADFTVADADYVITLDADSIVLGDYALRLVHEMERPGNERLAVIQSPVSAFSDCPVGLERAAGASIDAQFPLHQGYTHWNATFWVGASAMLRKRALSDIVEIREENGHSIPVFIQDRTVIEDTESTIDLVHKGWQLHNYPERMTFSATPPDFGALLIQRRRWANGGLIILPKLIQYAVRAPKTLALAKELYMRFHYLAATTLFSFAVAICFLYPFSPNLTSCYWFPLSALPFMLLFIRALRHSHYGPAEAARIFALNMMLFPILIGGVCKQFQQMITGKKIPFSRTPKVTDRTAAPALYSFISLLLPAASASVVILDAEQRQWIQAAFALFNAGFYFYALLRFVGIRAAAEDIAVGTQVYVRAAARSLEVIPATALRWVSEAFPAANRV